MTRSKRKTIGEDWVQGELQEPRYRVTIVGEYGVRSTEAGGVERVPLEREMTRAEMLKAPGYRYRDSEGNIFDPRRGI